VALHSTGSRAVRCGAVGFALILTVVACGSDTSRAGSLGSKTVFATYAAQGPPTGTTPLAAPSRSSKAVFRGEAGRVEKAFRALLDAYDRKDVAAVLARRTAQSRADELAFMKTYSIRLYRVNAIAVNGTTATIDYENAIVARGLKTYVTTLLAQHDVWTKQNGVWKETSDVSSTPGIPRGLAAVTATLRDGAPIVVPTPLPNADFAFLLKNTGSAAKGAFILGIPAKLDVPAFIPLITKIADERDNHIAASFPHGVLEMGATPDVPANGIGTMVFNARLPKGRYLLLAREAGYGPVLANEYAVFTVK